jgi:hypothetical protein
MSQSEFFKPFREFWTRASGEKVFHNNDMCLAEEAVTSEPVSADESLLSGKNTGKSVEYQ